MILAVRPQVREPALVAAAVIGAWAVLSSPWLVGGLTIPWDAKLQFLAMLRWLAEHLSQGDWPFWMPESYGGRPALGDPQSMMLSPGYLALAALNSDPSARACDAVVLVELLLGGLATAAIASRRRTHKADAMLAAVAMMFGVSASARLQHTLLVQSHAFLPVALLALDAALDRPGFGRALLAGAALGALAVGRDQVAYLGLIALSVVVVARCAGSDDPVAFLRQRLLPGALALLTAVAIAAVPVLATLEFAQVSNRPSFEFEHGAKQSLPPSMFLTLVVPNLLGSLSSAVHYWGPGSEGWVPLLPLDRTLVQLYGGMLPAVLVLWVGVLRGRLLRRDGWVMLGLGGFFTLYALGHYTPVFGFLFEHLPGVDMFRRPADATFALGAVLALAAGWLLDRLLREGLPPASRGRRVAEAVAALAVLAAAAGVAQSHGRLSQAAPAIASAAAMATAAVTLVVWLGRAGAATPGGRRTAWLVLGLALLLTVLDLRLFTVGTPLNALPVTLFAALDDPAEVPPAAWLEREVAELEAAEGPVRVEVLGLGGTWQNLPTALGVEHTLGYNPLRLAEYDRAVGAEQNSHMLSRRFGTLMTGYRSDFADLLGIRLIVLGGPMQEVDPASSAAFGPPRRFRGVWIYENRRALPRVLFIGREGARRYDPATLIEHGGLPLLDWRREALIDPLPEPPIAPAQARGPAGSVRIVARSADQVTLDVTARRRGYVVLHDIAYPGWFAYVDGVRHEPRRANALFMAVPVEAGRHQVRFAYEPLSPGHLWVLVSGGDE